MPRAKAFNRALAALVLTTTLVLSGCSMDFSASGQGGGGGGGAGGAPVDFATGTGPVWDAGNIISDKVFYDSNALPSVGAVQQALDKVGAECTGSSCLRTATYPAPSQSSQWCAPYSGGPTESYAAMLYKMGKACGINPQVAIVIVQKESQGLSKSSPPDALTGYGCPDTGAGGSANCNSASSGVFSQTWGMFQAFAKLHKDPSYVNYLEGQSHDILWNVVETGCGAAPVKVANRATATLYTYTPYQPNPASLAAYPGEGDRCSAYGNRNFFYMFNTWFGSTGGGTSNPNGGGGVTGDAVSANGPKVTIPNNSAVVESMRGKTITAPNAGVAKGLAAGFSKLGLPYVWGGGGDGAGENNGCARGGGELNSCGSEIGFDCSGLTAYVAVQAGYPSPGGNSGEQASKNQVGWNPNLVGAIITFPGHVAINLGVYDSVQYILEASTPGVPIHVVPLTRTDYNQQMNQYWTGGSA